MNDPKFSIPKPCNESWNNMTPVTQGRFCGQCRKTVIDFTVMKTTEIEEYLSAHRGERVCGRVAEKQLPKKPSAKMALASLIVSILATLAGCNNKPGDEGFPLGELAAPPQDSVSTHPSDTTQAMMGETSIDTLPEKTVALPPPPPVKQSKTFLTGAVAIDNTDTIASKGND